MIKLDPIVLDFVANNVLTIGLVIALLKGIAKETVSTTDDKIITLIANIFSSVTSKGGKIEKKS